MPPIYWTFDSNNPVIRPGQLNGAFDANCASACSVVRLGDMYRMFYWTSGHGKNYICQAVSPVETPNAWQGLGPVIEPDKSDVRRCQGARWPWALVVNERTIYLYYLSRGVQTDENPFPNTPWLSVSEDAGKTWREASPTPLLNMDKPYDRETIGSYCVLHDGERFRMYYTAAGEYVARPEGTDVYGKGDLAVIGIGLAYSHDGLHWEKPFDHFLIPPRFFATDVYETKVARPCVIQENGQWRMWISSLAKHYRVCSLTSGDGLYWRWQPCGASGDFGIGAPGSFDDQQRCYAMVVPHEREYRCWYTGNGYGATGMGYVVGAPSAGVSAEP